MRARDTCVKAAITRLAVAPDTRRAEGTSVTSPISSRTRELVLASALAISSQSSGAAMSSNKQTGGEIEIGRAHV